MNRPSKLVLAALAAATVALTAACSDSAADAATIAVVSTDDECRVAVTEAASGTLVFEVKNEGSKPTEFYLLAADGVRVVGEVEDIGPGLTRRLTVTVDPGSYLTACKPGMAGEGIRAGFTVTEPGGEQPAPR